MQQVHVAPMWRDRRHIVRRPRTPQYGCLAQREAVPEFIILGVRMTFGETGLPCFRYKRAERLIAET